MTDASGRPHRRGLIGRAVGVVAPAVVRQIDANDLVDAIDVNVIADELDLDVLIERLDIDAIANRLDLDALIERLDVNAIANRLDMAKLTAGATQDVAVTGLDLVRRQLVRADATVDAVVGRLIRRDPAARPEAPGRLAHQLEPLPIETDAGGELQRRDVSGHYAGAVTRSLALAGDVLAALGLQAALGWVLFLSLGLLFDTGMPSGLSRWVSLLAIVSAFVLYFWLPVALFGRTLAMALLGIAVVRRDGGIANGRRALVRALVLPVAILIPALLLGMLVGRERRTLYDVVSGTVEVYDWGEREAEQPVTIRQQLSARVRRREPHSVGSVRVD